MWMTYREVERILCLQFLLQIIYSCETVCYTLNAHLYSESSIKTPVGRLSMENGSQNLYNIHKIAINV